jgi:hypothetical protein
MEKGMYLFFLLTLTLQHSMEAEKRPKTESAGPPHPPKKVVEVATASSLSEGNEPWQLPASIRLLPPKEYEPHLRYDAEVVRGSEAEWRPLLRPMKWRSKPDAEVRMLVRENVQDWLAMRLRGERPSRLSFDDDWESSHDEIEEAVYSDTDRSRLTLQLRFVGICLHDINSSKGADVYNEHRRIIAVEWDPLRRTGASTVLRPGNVLVAALISVGFGLGGEERCNYAITKATLMDMRKSPYNSAFHFASDFNKEIK